MKYLLTYNINKGGSTSINNNYMGLCGEIEGNNKRELIKKVNSILRKNNTKKGSPFNWWYDICSVEKTVHSAHNFTND